MNGKGSRRRPYHVPRAVFEANWTAAFAGAHLTPNPQPPTITPMHDPSEPLSPRNALHTLQKIPTNWTSMSSFVLDTLRALRAGDTTALEHFLSLAKPDERTALDAALTHAEVWHARAGADCSCAATTALVAAREVLGVIFQYESHDPQVSRVLDLIEKALL